MNLKAIIEETLVAPMRAMSRASLTIAEERAALDDALDMMKAASRDTHILHMGPGEVDLILRHIERLKMLADAYRRVSSNHDRMVGDLRGMLENDETDRARDLVNDEYRSIHGPRD